MVNMRTILDDFTRWGFMNPEQFPRFETKPPPDEIWDDVPTGEWAHPLDGEDCDLCSGPCTYVTQEMEESAEWLPCPVLGGES